MSAAIERGRELLVDMERTYAQMQTALTYDEICAAQAAHHEAGRRYHEFAAAHPIVYRALGTGD